MGGRSVERCDGAIEHSGSWFSSILGQHQCGISWLRLWGRHLHGKRPIGPRVIGHATTAGAGNREGD
jgi:hypothetical protein